MVVRPFTFRRLEQGGDQFTVVGFQAAWKQVGSDYEWINATADTGVKYPARVAAANISAIFTTGG